MRRRSLGSKKFFKTFKLGMSSLEFGKHLATSEETTYQLVVGLVNNMLNTYYSQFAMIPRLA
jgi:hypothetical protein